MDELRYRSDVIVLGPDATTEDACRAIAEQARGQGHDPVAGTERAEELMPPITREVVRRKGRRVAISPDEFRERQHSIPFRWNHTLRTEVVGTRWWGYVTVREAAMSDDTNDLDASMFARHPDGYLCRCGGVQGGIDCVCPSDFPEQVIADLRERVAELEDGIRAHKSCIDARAWEYPAMKKPRPIPLQADLDLHALLDTLEVAGE